ncbi:MAG: GNAT family N-acetyltransferase [Microbacteriaceae bacterium]
MAEVREVPFEHADSTMLRAAQKAELAARYGTPDSEPGIAPSATDITAFFVAYEDGMPAGCGGLRKLTDDEAEIKRMYVTPAHRGTGISVAVLEALETFGRETGLVKLVLETGTLQPDAMRFYEREGYVRIPNFGPYVGELLSVCYEKTL